MALSGRPSKYSAKEAEEICKRLANGESLRKICKDEHLPSESTVRGWALDNICEFASKYARSRNLGLDSIAEGTLEISDDQELDPNARRVMVDTRKWLLSKMRPDKYGDQLKLQGDPDGSPVIQLVVMPAGAGAPPNSGK